MLINRAQLVSQMNLNEFDQHGAQDYRDDSGATGSARDDNCCSATKNAIEQADRAVRACNDVVVPEMEKLARKARFETVVIPVYAAAYMIVSNNDITEFLAEREVKTHGNVKNIFSPITVGFTKGTHPLLRDRLCKYSATMWLAYHKGIPPEEFQKWLKDNGIEKACAEYRRIMRELDKAERDKQIDKVLVDPKKEPDKAPLLPATPITGGCVGLKLAVVDFTLDGMGEFRLLGILPHDRDAVMRIVAAAAEAKAS